MLVFQLSELGLKLSFEIVELCKTLEAFIVDINTQLLAEGQSNLRKTVSVLHSRLLIHVLLILLVDATEHIFKQPISTVVEL